MHEYTCMIPMVDNFFQQAYNFKMTSYRRRCGVMTLHRRQYNVISTSCACWKGDKDLSNIKSTKLTFYSKIADSYILALVTVSMLRYLWTMAWFPPYTVSVVMPAPKIRVQKVWRSSGFGSKLKTED